MQRINKESTKLIYGLYDDGCAGLGATVTAVPSSILAASSNSASSIFRLKAFPVAKLIEVACPSHALVSRSAALTR
jgi:hypothetical protein